METAEGERTVLLSAFPLAVGATPQFGRVVVDITEQRRAERERAAAGADLAGRSQEARALRDELAASERRGSEAERAVQDVEHRAELLEQDRRALAADVAALERRLAESDEALAALDADETIREALGDELVDTFKVIKAKELERFDAWVTDWEFREYSHHL
jgi:chromosome segregation ATPase